MFEKKEIAAKWRYAYWCTYLHVTIKSHPHFPLSAPFPTSNPPPPCPTAHPSKATASPPTTSASTPNPPTTPSSPPRSANLRKQSVSQQLPNPRSTLWLQKKSSPSSNTLSPPSLTVPTSIRSCKLLKDTSLTVTTPPHSGNTRIYRRTSSVGVPAARCATGACFLSCARS